MSRSEGKKPVKRHSFEYLYGVHSVVAALRNPNRSYRSLYILRETLKKQDTLKEVCQSLKISPEILTEEEFLTLVPPTSLHQGVVLEADPLKPLILEDFLETAPSECLVLCLDQVTDPHNFGAILRSAAAFGVKAVIATVHHAPPLQGVTARASAGGIEQVPVISVTNLRQALQQLKKNNFWCYGLAEGGETSLESCALSGRIALVLGSEGSGLRRLTKEDCDMLVFLPTEPTFSTLNVSNAAAIALYEARRQMTHSPKKRSPHE